MIKCDSSVGWDVKPWLLPCWKWVCSRLRGAAVAAGLFSTGGGVRVRLWWCGQTLGFLTRGGTTTTTTTTAAAAGSWRSSGRRGWGRSVVGQTTILQPVGIQLHFVWGIKKWWLRFKPAAPNSAFFLVPGGAHKEETTYITMFYLVFETERCFIKKKITIISVTSV